MLWRWCLSLLYHQRNVPNKALGLRPRVLYQCSREGLYYRHGSAPLQCTTQQSMTSPPLCASWPTSTFNTSWASFRMPNVPRSGSQLLRNICTLLTTMYEERHIMQFTFVQVPSRNVILHGILDNEPYCWQISSARHYQVHVLPASACHWTMCPSLPTWQSLQCQGATGFPFPNYNIYITNVLHFRPWGFKLGYNVIHCTYVQIVLCCASSDATQSLFPLFGFQNLCVALNLIYCTMSLYMYKLCVFYSFSTAQTLKFDSSY